MRARVWLLAHAERLELLETELRGYGIDVQRVSHEMADLALSVYDTSGLLLVDGMSPDGLNVLGAGVALLPVLAIVGDQVNVPPGVMRVEPLDEGPALAHQIREVLNAPRNQRSYPRFRTDLRIGVGDFQTNVRDISFYGMWLETAGMWSEGQQLELVITLEDGARISLDGNVAALRDGGAAIRSRPQTDMDLVLWIHLLLGALEDSPLHRDADPFGPLFESVSYTHLTLPTIYSV